MRMLNISDVSYISGASAESYRMAVNLDIAKVMTAKFNQCNVNDLTTNMFQSAVSGGVLGTITGSVAVPGIGMVPGWLFGAASGAAGGAFTYGLSCWW